MNREEIMGIMPHRDNMLLLDEAVMEDGKARGVYRVRGDEWFLKGHFPGRPVVPGVVLCEIMAQTCCVLLADKVMGRTPVLTGLDSVRFRSKVKPGDLIRMVCVVLREKDPFYFARGEGYVDDRLCVSGEFSFAFVKGV